MEVVTRSAADIQAFIECLRNIESIPSEEWL
jgi:hypothetical protein